MKYRSVELAYNTIAADYDQQVQRDAWMRVILWNHYMRRFHPGYRVLDISCKTGIDSIFLAQRGMYVVGIDISPGMIRELRAKVDRLGLQDRVKACVLDVTELDTWPSESFDGILSAFAGLNTLPNLAPFAAAAARLLRPGGHLVLHLLNRLSLWESFSLLVHGRLGQACRLAYQGERIFVIGGHPVRHYLCLPGATYRKFFAPFFHLRQVYSLGALRPPPTGSTIPLPVVWALGGLERRVNSYQPFVNWGRFFVLDLQRRLSAEPSIGRG